MINVVENDTIVGKYYTFGGKRFYVFTKALESGVTGTDAPAGSMATTTNTVGRTEEFYSDGTHWVVENLGNTDDSVAIAAAQAYSIQRSHHTGTQLASTISDFTSAVLASSPPLDPKVIPIGVGQAYETIMEAMAGITDATGDNVYWLKLLPTYKRAPNLWDTFTWNPYIRLEGDLWHINDLNIASGGTLQTDKVFHGISVDFSHASHWVFATKGLEGLSFGALFNNANVVANTAALIAATAVQGDIYLVLNDGGGNGSLFCLSTSDPTVLGNWINISTTLSSGMSFSGLSIPSFSAKGLKASSTSWEACNLERCFITHSVLDYANFSFSNLYLGDFEACNLTNSFWKGANLFQAYIGTSTLTSANFSYANLKSVYTDNSDYTGANFTGADLRGCTFDTCNLSTATFSQADTRGTDFTGSTLSIDKVSFKAAVDHWDASTTIWTDGNPIG